jgi:hypothetical protein
MIGRRQHDLLSEDVQTIRARGLDGQLIVINGHLIRDEMPPFRQSRAAYIADEERLSQGESRKSNLGEGVHEAIETCLQNSSRWGLAHMTQLSSERWIESRVEELFDVAKGSKGRPDFAHGFKIERLERSDGFRIKVYRTAEAVLWLLESFVAQEDGAGDDAGSELEQHDRVGRGIQACGEIAPPAFASGQLAPKEVLLHLFDGALAKAFDPVAHWKNPNCGNFTGHDRWPHLRENLSALTHRFEARYRGPLSGVVAHGERLTPILRKECNMTRTNRWMPWTCGMLMIAGMSFLPMSDHSARADERDRQLNPKLHHAIEALKEAHDEIDSAHHDFHGRKKEALEVIDKAMAELEAIKDYDR